MQTGTLGVDLLQASEDLSAWDTFVDGSPQGSIFAQSWWLRAVCGDRFQILTVAGQDGIEAGLPMVKTERLGLTLLHMPQLTQTLGILLGPAKSDKYESQLSSEMKLIREIVGNIPKFSYFHLSFHPNFTNWLPFFWAGYSQTTRYTYRFEKVPDDETIMSGMDKSTRKTLRKTEKAGIRVEETNDIGELLALNTLTFQRQNKVPPYPDDFVRRIDASCAEHGARRILVAKGSDDKTHIACYVVYDGRTMYALMSGGDPELRNSGAHVAAKFYSLQLAREMNLSFDFEGSMMSNIEPFFRSFGAEQRPYFVITKGAAGPLIRHGATLSKRVPKLMRRLGIRK